MTEAEETMLKRYHAQIEALSAAAFAAGCRLAITKPELIMNPHTLGYDFQWQHVILSPGESPPRGLGRVWTVYEQRNGIAQGRSL